MSYTLTKKVDNMKEIIKILKAMLIQYPNDADLGRAIREYINKL